MKLPQLDGLVAYSVPWAASSAIRVEPGDVIIFAGVYARRTFWQWLTRKPRKLKIFLITEVT